MSINSRQRTSSEPASGGSAGSVRAYETMERRTAHPGTPEFGLRQPRLDGRVPRRGGRHRFPTGGSERQ